jgi:hypothetical protein
MTPENCAEFFVHNIERVESLGSTSRIVFCVPKSRERSTVNEVALTLIVPTDQLGAMVAKLMIAPSKSITCQPDEVGEEVRH